MFITFLGVWTRSCKSGVRVSGAERGKNEQKQNTKETKKQNCRMGVPGRRVPARARITRSVRFWRPCYLRTAQRVQRARRAHPGSAITV